jgi:methyl-accepting chemotaxis protein
MDKVTQQNAANAEESASASEELNAQADQLQDMVRQLARMVGASTNGHGTPRALGAGNARRNKTIQPPTGSRAGGRGRTESEQYGTELATSGARVVKPDDVVATGGGDFEEF